MHATIELFRERQITLRKAEHANCFVCDPENSRGLHLNAIPDREGRLNAEFQCDDVFRGYSGRLHGGVVAALLDGAMTQCCFAHGIKAVTGELTVRFRQSVMLHRKATVIAWMASSRPPLYILKAELKQGSKILVKAVGKFMA
jgi:acyl-coenzyme A thioesterase PaaI-like protein